MSAYSHQKPRCFIWNKKSTAKGITIAKQIAIGKVGNKTKKCLNERETKPGNAKLENKGSNSSFSGEPAVLKYVSALSKIIEENTH